MQPIVSYVNSDIRNVLFRDLQINRVGVSVVHEKLFRGNVLRSQNGQRGISDATPKKILYCYGIHQPLFDDMERKYINLKLHHGLPSTEAIDELTSERQHALIVLDDLKQSGAEYRHGGIIYPRLSPPTTQCNLHYIKLISRGSKSKTIALNTYYLILMKNARDVSQVTTLSLQLYPGSSRLLVEAYRDATKQPFGYLVIDTSPKTDDKYRLRTNVFPGEDPVVYSIL